MGFFDKFLGQGKKVADRLSGNADFLEAVCAASSLVGAADGSFTDEEIVSAIEGVQNNATLSSVYTADQIEQEMLKQSKKAKSPSGRVQLKREITDVAQKDPTIREDVFLIAADVAYADGTVTPEERKVLDSIAGLLRLDAEKLLAA